MKKILNVAAIGSLLALFVLGGCATAPTAGNAGADPDEGYVKVSGKVVETANAGGYTYVCLERNGKRSWAAVPPTEVKVGEEMELMPGGEMKGFTSSALGKTFDSIIFSGGAIDAAHAKKVAKAETKPAPPAEAAKAPEKPVLAGKVVETMAAGNYTYILLEKDGHKGWSAVPLSKVNIGDELELLPGAEMGQFTSNTLKRTFDNIYFSGGIKGAKGESAEKAARDEKAAKAEQVAKMEQAHAGMKPAAAAKTPAAPIEGKVVETMNSGGYSYVCVEKDGKKTWLAAPSMKVAVGDTVSFQPGMEMSNFTSKSLNRSFEKIIFSNGPTPPAAK